MMIFISYCSTEEQGLKYAIKAGNICKDKNIHPWIWEYDASSAEHLTSEIVTNVKGCNAMLIIATSGSIDSEGQKQEWSFANSFHLVRASLQLEGTELIDELRDKKCPRFNESTFETVCNKVIDDIINALESKEPIIESYSNKQNYLHSIASILKTRKEGLITERVTEFFNNVWEGYLESAIIRNIVSQARASEEDKDKLINIVVHSTIDLDEFNAQDYLWEIAFKQLGRAIAAGEERKLFETIQTEVKPLKEAYTANNDDLSIVRSEIKRLCNTGTTPNIIIIPPIMFKYFINYFKEEHDKLDFQLELGSRATLEINNIGKLRIYISVRTDNMIIFNNSGIIWKVLPDPETGYALTLDIGKGIYPDKINYVIGTTVRCIVKNKEGISIIPIEK